jgi:hypothetical protein
MNDVSMAISLAGSQPLHYGLRGDDAVAAGALHVPLADQE